MRIGNQIPGHFCSYDQNETALSENISASGLTGNGGALARTDKIHARDSKQPVRAREWLFKSSWYTKPQYRVFYDSPLAYQNQWDSVS